jgi:hypothetical protein
MVDLICNTFTSDVNEQAVPYRQLTSQTRVQSCATFSQIHCGRNGGVADLSPIFKIFRTDYDPTTAQYSSVTVK